jgi:hypothetical protein
MNGMRLTGILIAVLAISVWSLAQSSGGSGGQSAAAGQAAAAAPGGNGLRRPRRSRSLMPIRPRRR